MRNRILIIAVIITLFSTLLAGCSVKNSIENQPQTNSLQTVQEGSNYKATIKTGKGLKNTISVQEKTDRTAQIKSLAKNNNVINLSGNGLVDFGTIQEDVLQVFPYCCNSFEVIDFGLLVNSNGTVFKVNFAEEVKESADQPFVSQTKFKVTKMGEDCKKLFSCPESNYYGFLRNDGSVVFYGVPPESAMMPVDSGMRRMFQDSYGMCEGKLILEKVSDFWAFDNCFVYIMNNSLYLTTDKEILIEKDCGTIKDVCASVSEYNYDEVMLMYAKETGALCSYDSNNGIYNVNIDFPVRKIFFADNQVWALSSDNNLYLWGSVFKNLDEKVANVASEEPLLIASNILDFNANYYKRYLDKVLDVYALTENGEILLANSDVSVGRKKIMNQVTIYSPVVYEQVKSLFPRCWVTQNNTFILDAEGYKNININKDNYLVNLRWFTCAESTMQNQKNIVSKDVLVDKNVTTISGDKYIKNSQLYRYTRKGIQKVPMGKGANAISLYCFDVAQNFNYVFVDNLNRVWLKRKPAMYADDLELFWPVYYRKQNFAKQEPEVVESGIDKIWIDEYGAAFVKDGNLYAHGTLEMFRDIYEGVDDSHDSYEDYIELPNKLVKYSGVDANDVAEVTFSQTKMFVTMKNGEVYEIFPKQDSSQKIEKRKYVSSRKITSQDKLEVSNVLLYKDNYYILQNNEAVLNFENSKRELKNVKKVVYGENGDVCFILKKNGDLYGWGYNGARMISKEAVEFIPFENRVLVAKNVKDFSVYHDKLFYLNEEDDLFFRGYKGLWWDRNPNELVDWVTAEEKFKRFM